MKTITDIEGVYASGVNCGIKPEKKDLAYIYIPQAVASAAVFTKNTFAAPCVEYSRSVFSKSVIKAVVVNSGNANAATGLQGYKNAVTTAELAAGLLKIAPEEVAVASTGIIGRQLPLDKIKQGLTGLLADPRRKQGELAAEAILTTDTFAKQVFITRQIAGKSVSIAGFAKGSGMIAPDMATMLAFMVIDVAIPSADLDRRLRAAVDKSFNMISVDTDTSTNDLMMVFSTGAVEIDLCASDVDEQMSALLTEAATELAKMVARDGEGAEKLVEVNLCGAANDEEAKQLALSVINSPLVKTAIHGSDPNWGRIIAALGKVSCVALDPARVDLKFGEIEILRKCEMVCSDLSLAANALRGPEVCIKIDLNIGTGTATAWGCDLTKGYIDINTAYN